ncbi:MAG: peptidoglycan-associated lipoprotein Pal [Desulforhopalus sp.]
MFRSYLIVGLLMSALLASGGCAQKSITDVEVTPTPAVTQTVVEPAVTPPIEVDSKSLEKILFDYDSFSLSPASQQLLKKNAKWLSENPELEVIIEGHSDERGSGEYNLALGERRAMSTKNYLAELGVAPERLDVISYGEERPISLGHDETAWAQNRRVEFSADRH